MSYHKENPTQFKSAAQYRKWLEKNHNKEKEIWIIFYKKAYDQGILTYSQATDQSYCFGWSIGIIKRIDIQTYKARFTRRAKKSSWSSKTAKKFRELQKKGLTHPAGDLAFKNREKTKKEILQFSSSYLSAFKKNKKAWDFFESQNPSYKKHMIRWVMEAKREETRSKRLKELIQDSSEESKLKRIVKAIEKTKPVYKKGQTPIEAGRNIGPVSGTELRAIGLNTLEKLISVGWEEAFFKLCEVYPHRLNLNMLTGLIGAVEDQPWNKLDPDLKVQAKQYIRSIRRDLEHY